MTITRGDVVILSAPFVSRPGSKLRPMLVVQKDRNNARMGNTILATITTNTSRSAEPTQVLIDPQLPTSTANEMNHRVSEIVRQLSSKRHLTRSARRFDSP